MSTISINWFLIGFTNDTIGVQLCHFTKDTIGVQLVLQMTQLRSSGTCQL